MYLLGLLLENVVESIDRAIINDSLVVIYPKRHEGRPVGLDSQIALDVAILG